MQRLARFICGSALSTLIVACGGGNVSPVLPASSTLEQPQAVFPNAERIGFEGQIAALRSGGYTMSGSAGEGYVHVNTTSSTRFDTYGGSAGVGHYALLVGGGSISTAITASYVATFSSKPGSITLHGTYAGATYYGFELKTTDYGIVPVMTSTASSLSGTLTAGGAVTVQGTGSTAAILAASVAAAGADPTYPPTIAQTHMITADYLGTPDGSTTVSAAQAAPHLNWAETGIVNTQTIAAAGIKTMVYLDMDRLTSTEPLYATLSGDEYEETCGGARVSDFWDNTTQYLTNPASSAARQKIDKYVTTYTAGHTVDAIFEDDADPLSEYAASYFSPGAPCAYSDSAWIAGEKEMLAGYDHDTFVNGFSQMSQAAPVPNATQLLANATTIGGNMESCYVKNSSPIEQVTWVWAATENTSLAVTSQHKYFECWAMDYGAASSEIASRIYMLASFLMTYDPTYSIFREGYATSSGLHVMPESQLVPTAPVVPQPASVSTLEESYVYVREYRACYFAGKLVGQCAMVVNNDTAVHPTPALALTYRHTLSLSGSGMLDGGSVGFDGVAPPANLAERSAFVALP